MDIPGHAFGNLVFSFSPGKKKVPTHFQDLAGQYYQRRVQVDRAGFPLLSVELSCLSDTNIATGFMTIERGRRIEMYFQVDSQGTRRQIDVYMDYPQALGNVYDEKMSVRFESTDGADYDLWGVRTTNSATEGSYGVAMSGNQDSQQAQIAVIEDTDATPDDTTQIHLAASSCVDIATGETTTGCGTISAPQPTVQGSGFSVNETDAIEVETIELLRSGQEVYNLGNTELGNSYDQVVEISNIGSVEATSISSSSPDQGFSFKGGAYPGAGGTCATVLGASSTCTIVIAYTPASTGTTQSVFRLDYLMNSIPYATSVGLLATNIANSSAAVLTMSEGEPYDFGTVSLGSSNQHLFVITNSGASSATALSAATLPAPFSFTGGSYPGTGGDCATTLTSGASCNISLQFSPTAAGVFNDSFSLSYNDGIQSQTLTRLLQGTGASLANLTISDSPSYDFGSITVGSSATHTFTVSNTGVGAASALMSTSLSAPFEFLGGTYPGTGGTCGASLAAGATCSVVVSYSPTSVGSANSSLSVSYNNGSTTQSVSTNVVGQGAAGANLIISETDPFDFGTHVVGGVSTHTFTVTNTGGGTASAMAETGLSAPFGFQGGSYPGTGGTCTTTLAAAATCQLVIAFSPTATGSATDTIDLNYNDGAATQVVSRQVQGIGTTAASLTISNGPTYDYGTLSLGGTLDATFTVTNAGGGVATSLAGSGLVAPFAFTGGAYSGTGGTCGATLAAGATCTMVVGYSPTSAGAHSDTITLDYNDGVAAQQTSRAVTGTGANPAVLTISESNPYDFGTIPVGGQATHTFTVTNTGAASATSLSETGLAAPFTFLGGAYPGTGGTCGVTLAAAANCTLVVAAAPTAVGAHTDSIVLSYFDGAAAQSTSRDLSFTGVAPALITISETNPYDFGSVTVSSNASHSFTLTNTGGVTATAISASGLAAPFNFSGGSYPGISGTCTSNMAPGSSCTVELEFSPTVTGLATDTLDINYNDGVSASLSSRNVQGTGI